MEDCVKHLQLSYVVFTLLIAASVSPSISAQQAGSADETIYRFKLTKGAGAQVCDAYLERLNTTQYKSPPYCDRPENDTVPGFTKLNRAPLAAEEVQVLFPRIQGFTWNRNQDSHDLGNAAKVLLGMPLPQDDLSTVKGNLAWGLKVWRYDPAIDIDNDNVPDNIIVWHGIGASNSSGVCGGGDASYKGPEEVKLHQAQIAYLLTRSNDRIDVFNTMTIFGHPSGSYVLSTKGGRGTPSSRFRPIGPSIGIFKYEDLYYFDTFFDSSGDFENKRKKQVGLNNTLAVFLRNERKTQQLCEYQMTEIDNTTKRKN
jgi:hypothetical protein